MMPEVINTDLLIVGGGGAGCRAAIEAHDQGVKVILLVKGRLGNSGCTLNVGTSAAVGPWAENGDSNDVSMRDVASYGGYLGDQDLIKTLVDESMDRVIELERWGIDFDRNDDGSVTIGKAAAHSFPRNFTFRPPVPSQHDYGALPGIAIMDVLVEQVKKRDVSVIEESALVDLLTDDGRVVGAVAWNCRNGELVVLGAKAVVLATGSYSRIYSRTTVSPYETGDGHAAAYRVGAELVDMENTQFVPSAVGFPAGAVLLNAKGDSFISRYGAGLPATLTKERLCYAVCSEILAGRGTETDSVLIDMTGVPDNPAGAFYMSMYGESLRTTGSAYPGFEAKGVDVACGPFETAPLAHTTTGGVRTNVRSQSTVPGLYAAGAVAGGVYGHSRPEGYTSMITLVFGRRAGLFAAEECLQANTPKVSLEVARSSIDNVNGLIEKAGAVDVHGLKTRIRAAMTKYAWVIKDEEGLVRGLNEVGGLSEIHGAATLGQRPVDFKTQEVALEIPNLLLCAELMLRGAIVRKESRGAFFRSDYPDTDDSVWLRNLIFKRTVDGPVVDAVPVDLKYCRPEPTTAI